MTKSGSTIEFLYNADGIRTNKTVNGTNHIYTLNGTQIVSESWGNNLLIYLYDESGSPIGMQYRTTSYAANTFDTFYFEKNLQGEISEWLMRNQNATPQDFIDMLNNYYSKNLFNHFGPAHFCIKE